MDRVSKIRAEALAKRRSLSEEEVKSKSGLIANKLKEESREFDIILCFYPFSDEVFLLPLYEEFLCLGKKLFFPVTKGKDMSFFRCRKLSDFEKGRFDVMEPVLRDEAFSPGSDPVLCITPGVCFDVMGQRIGFGGGYYDRFFAGTGDGIRRVGVAFEECIRDEIPAMDWDVPMDMVISETDIYVRKEK